MSEGQEGRNDYLAKLNDEYPAEKAAAHEAFIRNENDPEEMGLRKLDRNKYGVREESLPAPSDYPVYDPENGDPEEEMLERLREEKGDSGESGNKN